MVISNKPGKLSEEVDIEKITKTLADEGIKNFPINTTKGTQHYFPSKSGKENIFMRAEDGNYVLDVYAANKPDFRELRSGNEDEILHNCRRAYNDKLNSYDDTLDDKYMSRFAEKRGKNMELKELIEKEASKRVLEQSGPIKTLIGFIRSGYCELKEPEILEFKQFLADEKDIYEEDYKKFRPLAEWQEYLEDFKEYKEAAEDNEDDSLQESKDNTYIARIGDKLYLQGNSQDGWDTTADAEEAAVFESKTEPTQIVNQMKKDGKISKNTSVSVEKFRESDEYEDIYDNPDVWNEIDDIERGGFDAFDNSDLSDDPKVIQRSIDMEYWKEKLPELSDVELGNLLDKIDSGDVPPQVEDYLEGCGHTEFIDDMLDPEKITVQNVYNNLKKEAETEGTIRDEDGYPCKDTSDNRIMEIIKYQMDSFVWEAADCTGVTEFLETFGPYKEMPKVGDAYNKVLTQAKQFNELAEGLMVKERIKIPE